MLSEGNLSVNKFILTPSIIFLWLIKSSDAVMSSFARVFAPRWRMFKIFTVQASIYGLCIVTVLSLYLKYIKHVFKQEVLLLCAHILCMCIGLELLLCKGNRCILCYATSRSPAFMMHFWRYVIFCALTNLCSRTTLWQWRVFSITGTDKFIS